MPARERGRAQLPAPSGCGRHYPRSCLGTDMCSVLCVFWFGFSFFSAHIFFFFPTISPARLPFMPQLHAPVCKLVGRVGTSPHSLVSADLVVWGGRAWFRSTHSGLIHASVNPLPSSTTGEDELGQHSMAPACSSLGSDQPRWCTPFVDAAGFPRCWDHWWPYPQPPGLHRALQARWRLVLLLLLASLLEQSLLCPITHVLASGHPVLPSRQGVGAGSHPATTTRSLSWPLMAGTSWDVALEESQGQQDAMR